MRRIILSIITITALNFGANAQNVNIPDVNLKHDLSEHGITITGPGINIIDTNGDDEIQVSEALAYTGKIQLGVAPGTGAIWDHTGIEAFANTTDFYLQNTQGTSLNLGPNTALTKISVQSNNITSLSLPGGTALTDLALYCTDIPMSLDISQYVNLINLTFRHSNFTSIDLSPFTLLETFDGENNEFTSITFPSPSVLTSVTCKTNSIASIDVSQLTSLTQFTCNDNQLTSLDVSMLQSLSILYCGWNDLTSLNVANGNNSNFSAFYTINNPNLTCVKVDDVAYSTSNWSDVDGGVSFSTSCGLGVNELLGTTINVYPNPASSIITIDTDEQIETIVIFDLFGSLIQQESTAMFSIEGLSSGVYFANVQTSAGMARVRFVKD
jgi:hypothetical protein